MLLAIQKAVHVDNVVGDIRCVYSDQSYDACGKRPDTERSVSAELAGGCLLDIGPYPMVWVSLAVLPFAEKLRSVRLQSLMMIFRHPKNEQTPPEKVGSTMLMYHTGVDSATSFAMTFPKVNAIAYCTLNKPWL